MRKLDHGLVLSIVIVLAWGVLGTCRCAAVVPYMAAATAAAPALPVATRLAKDVVAIPVKALQIVRLPLGVAETVLSPLPGLRAANGVSNIGRGLAAPFKLIGSVLDLPVSAVGGLMNAFSSAPQAACVSPGGPPAERPS